MKIYKIGLAGLFMIGVFAEDGVDKCESVDECFNIAIKTPLDNLFTYKEDNRDVKITKEYDQNDV